MSPEAREGSAVPGNSVTYSFQVTNQSNITDTISLSVSNNLWPVDYPSTVGPLMPGETRTISLSVNIPSFADGGVTDTSILTATSVGNRARTDKRYHGRRVIENGMRGAANDAENIALFEAFAVVTAPHHRH